MTRQAVFVELIGEPSMSKTHTSLLFLDPILADLTLRGKSRIILEKLYPDDWKDRYFRIKSFDDLRKALDKAHEDGRRTLVIETGSDLRFMGGEEWLRELQKKRPDREALHPTEWKQVNSWVNEIINKIMEEYQISIVITAEMQDEWGKDNKGMSRTTGRRKRSGYPRMDFYADIRLYLKVETEVEGVNPEVVHKKRVALVAKNGFINQTSSDWIPKIELPEDNDPSELKTFRLIMELTQLPEERWL